MFFAGFGIYFRPISGQQQNTNRRSPLAQAPQGQTEQHRIYSRSIYKYLCSTHSRIVPTSLTLRHTADRAMDVSSESFESLSYRELQVLAKSRQVKANGKKEDLIRRLIQVRCSMWPVHLRSSIKRRLTSPPVSRPHSDVHTIELSVVAIEGVGNT